jgi:glutamate formiminotransferase / formiminotetrahydrofolate cyclodeaminase
LYIIKNSIKQIMNSKQLIECVPNFSEGMDMSIIGEITNAIESVEGVSLLDVDPGKATNRTVVTFVGEPEKVIKAAFLGIKKASELIDMSKHKGEHPRMGATDVCPLIPIANISMEETVEWSKKLAEMVGRDLGIPVYLYESAAIKPERKNLATIRAGEYEGLALKIKDPNWKPDFGPTTFNSKSGATVIGARDFLIAYNVNLNTTSEKRANSVAFDIREKGRVLREGDPVNGKIILDENGEPKRTQGMLKGVKAIGWYIPEYGMAQISMNITDISQTSLHKAFEACCISATNRGMRVTGSELVGLVPLKVMLDAGKYFLRIQNRSSGVSEDELVRVAIHSMGLNELGLFDPSKKIIEYRMQGEKDSRLVKMSLKEFANETASESPAPGGGSISAYVGALGSALGGMVANLSSSKKGWEAKMSEFSDFAEKAQQIKDALLVMVDEDTAAFTLIMDAFKLPKSTPEETAIRKSKIQSATLYATEVPLRVMKTSFEIYPMLSAMVESGNQNSITDAGVGALCVSTAIQGAYLNVKVNAIGLSDKDVSKKFIQTGLDIFIESESICSKILKDVHTVLDK